MTFHSKAATDEIYEIFNQPLKCETADKDDTQSGCDSDYDDDDYTSAGESTGTGRISGTTSEVGDETGPLKPEEDSTQADSAESVSEWSSFTASKHIPKIDRPSVESEQDTNTQDDTSYSGFTAASHINMASSQEDLVTPTSPAYEEASLKTKFVPLPPQDYEPPTRQYRDPAEVAQSRLPFMTPIVEKTESSLAPSTVYEEKDYFNSKSITSKTPSRSKTSTNTKSPSALKVDKLLLSSPFQDAVSPPKRNNHEDDLSSPSKKRRTVETKAVSKPLEKLFNKVPIIADLTCSPIEDSIHSTILKNIHPPLASYTGFHDHSDCKNSRSTEIRAYVKTVSKASRSKSVNERTQTLAVPPMLKFMGTNRIYGIKRQLGQGAFAPVYLAESIDSTAGEDSDGEAEADANVPVMGKGAFATSSTRRQELEAIKMEHPPTAWEFYIGRLCHRRLGTSRAAESIVHVHEMHLFADEGYLIEEYRDQGTLLDLVNLSRAEAAASGSTTGASGGLEEPVCMFFAVELLRTMEALHKQGILHGDMKADNCLVRFDPTSEGDLGFYRADGSNGWSCKGLSLIDFGRGIDMRAFDPKVQFIADWKTTMQDCPEMRELRPWTYQIDYFGLAGTFHMLLFGKYIETVEEKTGGLGGTGGKTYRLREGFKRYWQGEIWAEAFGLLLNPGAEQGGLPVLKGMKRVRERMEEWLEMDGERKGLRLSVKKFEAMIKRGGR